jgi:hypothetical protein
VILPLRHGLECPIGLDDVFLRLVVELSGLLDPCPLDNPVTDLNHGTLQYTPTFLTASSLPGVLRVELIPVPDHQVLDSRVSDVPTPLALSVVEQDP